MLTMPFAARSRFAILVCLLTGVTPPTLAHAVNDVDSEALVRQGVELRKQGHDDLALPLFERAYAASPSGRTTAQLGLVKAALGDWVEADRLLQRSLVLGGAWVEKNRPALEDALKAMQSNIGDLTVTGTPPGARIAIDGRPVATLPMVASVRLVTGQRHLVVSAPGLADFSRDLTISGNQSAIVEVHLEAPGSPLVVTPTTIAAPPPSPGSIHGRAVLAWVAGGAAVGALAFGVFEHIRWSHDTSDFNSLSTPGGSGPACAAGAPMHGLVSQCGTLYDQYATARTLTFVGYGAAVALAATSLGLFIWDAHSTKQNQDAVARACGPDVAHNGWQCVVTF
jgi:hypothetical protein